MCLSRNCTIRLLSLMQCNHFQVIFISKESEFNSIQFIRNGLISVKEQLIPLTVFWSLRLDNYIASYIQHNQRISLLLAKNGIVKCFLFFFKSEFFFLLLYILYRFGHGAWREAQGSQGSTVGKVLTLLFLLMRLSGRALDCLVWISSSGVLPSGGSSRFLLFLVSGSH